MAIPKHAVLTVDGSTNIYGYLVKFPGTEDGQDKFVLLEMFATNPHAAGASELGAGTLHDSRNAREITQRYFNAAFLMDSDESIDDADATATLNELRLRYPDETTWWSDPKGNPNATLQHERRQQ